MSRIALFTALESSEVSKARLWSEKGLARFPNNSKILAFGAEARRLSEEYTESQIYLDQARSLDEKSPLVYLVQGRLYLDKKEYTLAREQFDTVVGLDIGGFFSEKAKEELAKIPTNPLPESLETTTSPE